MHTERNVKDEHLCHQEIWKMADNSMNDFNRFLIKVITVCGLMVSLFIILFLGIFQRPDANINTQHNVLTQSVSPKLIYFGGSNALFGIDSERLENKIQRPVVNYSIQAGLPLSFYIREISPYLSKGDVVLLVLEYGYYFGNVNEESITSIIETYPSGISSLLPEYWQDAPFYFKKVLLRQLQRMASADSADTDTFKREYNKWGDAVYMLDYDGEITMDTGNGTIQPVANIDPEIIQEIKQFGEFAESKGARVLITYPSMWNKQFDPQKENAMALDNYLRQQLPGMVISTPTQYTFTKQYISNTSYHLDRAGREIRTDMIIDDLVNAGIIQQ